MSPEERRGRGFRVQAMMQDGEINSAFDDVRADFIEEWERTHDAAERDNLWRAGRKQMPARLKDAVNLPEVPKEGFVIPLPP